MPTKYTVNKYRRNDGNRKSADFKTSGWMMKNNSSRLKTIISTITKKRRLSARQFHHLYSSKFSRNRLFLCNIILSRTLGKMRPRLVLTLKPNSNITFEYRCENPEKKKKPWKLDLTIAKPEHLLCYPLPNVK